MKNINILLRKIKTVLKGPKSVLIKALYLLSPMFSDKTYLKMLFYLLVGYKLDLENPKTYNEKMQWLKLNYRKPEFSSMVDKYEVKKIIENKVGKEYVAQALGIWTSFDEIDFDKLPNQFVLKPTHTSGGTVICKDKNTFNKIGARKKLTKMLKLRHYYLTREWPYKNVKPRILAEEYLNLDNNSNDILDYKFYCFNGVPKMMYIANAKYGLERIVSFYDMNFNKQDISKPCMMEVNCQIEQPKSFNKMKEIASKLSEGHPFIRIDFFDVDGKLKFSEHTFYHSGGMSPFFPKEWDYTFGNWIDLTKIQQI